MADFTAFVQAPSYSPPLHHNVDAFRLQGGEVSATDSHWVGLSVYHAGASVDESPVRAESIYVVLEGQLVVTVGAVEYVLARHDSLHMNEGEMRSVENRTDTDALLLVSIANPREQ
ncbi:MAG: cupin domain-containing protein [Actinomycetes bacterium]